MALHCIALLVGVSYLSDGQSAGSIINLLGTPFEFYFGTKSTQLLFILFIVVHRLDATVARVGSTSVSYWKTQFIQGLSIRDVTVIIITVCKDTWKLNCVMVMGFFQNGILMF
ncbi:hypothetical protein BGW37DRAFT_175279 [Umbelopsis sp. PMI_123]|nr:hypothetical protein BGW37DRAFT_175279 [Umbelopsis sp. PMI_123]